MIALFSALGVDLPEAGTVIAHAHGHRLAARRHRRSRCSRASCPRGGPPACRRSRRSARARRCRPSRFAAHSAEDRRSACSLASLAAISRRHVRRRAGAARGRAAARRRRARRCSWASRCWRRSLVKPLARVVGWPARRAGGVAGDLAGANSVRNPSRTASTAAALMIGLTLVTVVAVLGAGMHRRYEVGDHRPGPRRLRRRRQRRPAVPGRRGRRARARARA